MGKVWGERFDMGGDEVIGSWDINRIKPEMVGRVGKPTVYQVVWGIAGTLDYMGYKGAPPKVVLSEGPILWRGHPIPGSFDWSDDSEKRIIRIGVGAFHLMEEAGFPERIIPVFVASSEAVHFVQDSEGRLPHESQGVDELYSLSHYEGENRWYEREERAVAIKVVNRYVGYEMMKWTPPANDTRRGGV